MLELMKTQVPTLAKIEFDILHAANAVFSSNLTYTMENFSNYFDKDNNLNSYFFGIWTPIFFQTCKLASRKNGFDYKRNQFLLGSFKICIDFNACDGIVEIIWCERSDFHNIILSTTRYTY